MISHSFSSMRFPSRRDGLPGSWRRELLPNVARLVEGRRRNLIRGQFHSSEIGYVHASRRAAQVIAQTIMEHSLRPEGLDQDQRSLSADEFKKIILPLIGYGLGQFDLIVVDEAHRARAEDSSLSRILGPVSWETDDPFRLGMTATPVELDPGQWIDTLGRINGRDDGQETAALAELTDTIKRYVDIVRRVQSEELDEALTEEFEAAANCFSDALRPYVLRRDKRSDPEICAFREKYGDYRQVVDIAVSPDVEGFNHVWLRRFCAAEALSLLPHDNPRVKSARLSIAKGFGVGFGNSEDDASRDEVHSILAGSADSIGFWEEAFAAQDSDVYDHPAILAAVRKIESYTQNDEKVLVFGKFLIPMSALTRLLDAREMLRRLRDGKHWPASGLVKESIPAVSAALKDPGLAVEGGVGAVDAMLKTRYQAWAAERRTELARLHREVETLAVQRGTAAFLTDLLRSDNEREGFQIGALLEALGDRRDMVDASWTGREMLTLFEELLREIIGENEAEDEDRQRDRLKTYLRDYSGREGNFARMMSGATAPQTRRMLQAAFNRKARWPMVLVAQSLVGREGLNLHKACRTVVLLHAEWNPGVVEQQIGRVDRKGSLWLRELHDWRDRGDGQPPHIRVHPVVVSGTYDDHNWQVLKSRWLEFRAQLHGDVLRVDSDLPKTNDDKCVYAERVQRAVPDFSPRPQGA